MDTLKAKLTEKGRDVKILAYIHQVLLHVVGEVLEHSHLTDKMFWNLRSWEDRPLTQLCIVMDGPEHRVKKQHEPNISGAP